MGLAHRIPSLNAYVACAGGEAVHAASFLICDCCGSAEEFDPGVADLASAMAQARSFQPRTISVEVRGVCARLRRRRRGRRPEGLRWDPGLIGSI